MSGQGKRPYTVDDMKNDIENGDVERLQLPRDLQRSMLLLKFAEIRRDMGRELAGLRDKLADLIDAETMHQYVRPYLPNDKAGFMIAMEFDLENQGGAVVTCITNDRMERPDLSSQIVIATNKVKAMEAKVAIHDALVAQFRDRDVPEPEQEKPHHVH